MSSSDTQQGWEQVAAEADALCSAATPGPWEAGGNIECHDEGQNCWHAFGVEAQIFPPLGQSGPVAIASQGESDFNNAAFIARARTLVPELAALVRQQAAELALQHRRSIEFADALVEERTANLRADLAHTAAEVARLRDREQADLGMAANGWRPRLARVREDYDVNCQRCGSPHWIDTVLPSDTWNQIADPSDLLCMLCIDDLLFEKGLSAQAEFYFGGKALVGRMYEASLSDIQALRSASIRAADVLSRAASPAALTPLGAGEAEGA